VVAKTVEGVRNAEDGPKRGDGIPARVWMPPVEVAKRAENPREGARDAWRSGRKARLSRIQGRSEVAEL
jgi:hypothetical protein